MSEIVEAALRAYLSEERGGRAKPDPLPSFDSGGALVDVANRDALYRAMEGPVDALFAVDTSVFVYAAERESDSTSGPCARSATGARPPSDLRGNVVHDLHTAVLMREHGVRVIRTTDMDFHRFPFLDVVDPFA